MLEPAEPMTKQQQWLLGRVRRRRAALMEELAMFRSDPSRWRESFIEEAARRFVEPLAELIELVDGATVEDENP